MMESEGVGERDGQQAQHHVALQAIFTTLLQQRRSADCWQPTLCKLVSRDWRDAFCAALGPVQTVRLPATVQLGSASAGPIVAALSAWAARHAAECEDYQLSIVCLRGSAVDVGATVALHQALWSQPGKGTARLEMLLPPAVGTSLPRLVQHCPGLRSLHLDCSSLEFHRQVSCDRGLTEGLLAALAALPELQELELRGGRLHTDFGTLLASLPSQLTSLAIGHATFAGEGHQGTNVAELVRLGRLRSLSLVRLGPGHFFVAQPGLLPAQAQVIPPLLAAISSLTTLTKLDLSGNSLYELPLSRINLSPLCGLRHLDLANCNICQLPSGLGGLQLTFLAASGEEPAFQGLDLGVLSCLQDLQLRCMDDFAELAPTPAVWRLLALTSLALAGEAFQPVVAALLEGQAPSGLQRLELFDCGLLDWPQDLLWPALTHLDVSGNSMVRMPAALAPALGELRHLGLWGCGLRRLPPAISQLTALTSLMLAGNSGLSLDPALLAGLPSLRTLSLSLQGAVPGGMAALTGLTCLEVEGHGEIHQLSNLAPLSGTLRRLGLPRCYLSTLPEGLAALTLLDMSHMHRLPTVGSLSSLPSLRELDLSHSMLDALPAGITQLQSLTRVDVRGAWHAQLRLSASEEAWLRECWGWGGGLGKGEGGAPQVLFRQW